MTLEIPLEREWLTYREAQLLTGYGRTTLSKLVNTGAIFASKYGHAVRIDRQSLRDYLVAQAHQGAKDASPVGEPGALGGQH